MSWASVAQVARHALQLPKLLSLSWRLFMDHRVSGGLKLATAAAALFIVSPLDLLSDIPIIGPLDDIALLMLLVNVFVWLSPRAIVDELSGGNAPVQRMPDPAAMKNVTPKSS
ncbi:MAG TPA: YkvA family protein [Candidatus Tumulicola sp.]|nr:YkvA family protein [Candidatus Tumulicola sp.]